MGIKGTLTEKNIKAALAGESLARNKYTFYAMQAKNEGHEEVAKLFETMAVNESYHAKIWFSLLNNGLGTTKENLTNSAQGENDEWADMYPEFAKTAREEGLEDIAIMFEKVAAIEKEHERRFLKALIALKSNAPIEEQVTKTTKKIGYVCMFCGATFEDRPDVCSVCGAIGSFDKKVIG